MNKLPILLLIAVVVSGCASPDPICYTKPPLNLGHPDPLTLEPIRGKVVRSKEDTMVCLSLREYQALIENNKKIEGYIDQCVKMLDATEEYYNSE